MFGKLNASEIEEVLHNQLVGRLGCHADGVTYVVPLSYAYDGHFLYGRSLEGMKIDMMRRNPAVCFQVDNLQNMANWRSVIVWGEFEELVDDRLRNEALQILADRKLPMISSETTHLSATWPFPDDDVSAIEGIVFRIRVKDKSGRYERSESVQAFMP